MEFAGVGAQSDPCHQCGCVLNGTVSPCLLFHVLGDDVEKQIIRVIIAHAHAVLETEGLPLVEVLSQAIDRVLPRESHELDLPLRLQLLLTTHEVNGVPTPELKSVSQSGNCISHHV